jgi:amino acid transporter
VITIAFLSTFFLSLCSALHFRGNWGETKFGRFFLMLFLSNTVAIVVVGFSVFIPIQHELENLQRNAANAFYKANMHAKISNSSEFSWNGNRYHCFASTVGTRCKLEQ